MADGKAEKLLSEVKPGDFPTEAIHNEQGMYTIKDSEPGKLDGEKLIQLESGIWVEKPNQKEIRMLTVNTGAAHFTYECEESYDQILAILKEANERNGEGWTQLTDPIFGFRIAVPLAALLHPISITTQLRDLEAIRDQMKAYEMQQRMNRLQQASQNKSQQIVEQYKRNKSN
jgi:hypothetical protein